MKKTKDLLSIAVAFCIASSAFAQTEDFTINGTLVTKAAQEEIIKTFLAQGMQRTPQLEKRAQYILARDAIILDIAKKDKIQRKPSVRKAIRKATNAILVNEVVESWLKKNPVTDSEIQALYEKEKIRWGITEVKVIHILTPEEEKAKELLAKVKDGANIAELVKVETKNNPKMKLTGGLIDWTSPNNFTKEFAAAINKLTLGQVAAEPVKTSYGWHVVKLLGRRPAERYNTIEPHKESLKRLLSQQKVQAHFNALVQNAKIQTAKVDTSKAIKSNKPQSETMTKKLP